MPSKGHKKCCINIFIQYGSLDIILLPTNMDKQKRREEGNEGEREEKEEEEEEDKKGRKGGERKEK